MGLQSFRSARCNSMYVCGSHVSLRCQRWKGQRNARIFLANGGVEGTPTSRRERLGMYGRYFASVKSSTPKMSTVVCIPRSSRRLCGDHRRWLSSCDSQEHKAVSFRFKSAVRAIDNGEAFR